MKAGWFLEGLLPSLQPGPPCPGRACAGPGLHAGRSGLGLGLRASHKVVREPVLWEFMRFSSSETPFDQIMFAFLILQLLVVCFNVIFLDFN